MTTYQPPAYGGNTTDIYATPLGQDTSSVASRALRDFRNEAIPEAVRWESGPNVGKVVPGVVRIRYRIHNLVGGFNRAWGTARAPSAYYPYSDLDRFVRSSFLTDEPGVLSLTPLTKDDALANYGNAYPMASADLFSRHIIANGKTANQTVWVETSATDPTLISVTYTPTTVVSNIQKGIIGGASQAEKLFLYKEGTACHVLSDINAAGPTVYGTMHANTNPGWGHIRSYINAANPGAETLLQYINGTISSLDSTSAVGTAPTAVLTAVPNGGYPIGERCMKLPGQPLSAYWFFPNDANLTHSVCNLIDNSGVKTGKIVRTNPEGSDAQDVRLPLNRLLGAAPYGDSIVFWDGKSIWQLTDAARNLNIFKARYGWNAVGQNSDLEFQILAVWPNVNGDLYVLVTENNIPSQTGSMAVEKYIPSTGAWHRVTSAVTSVAGSSISVAPYLLGTAMHSFSPGSSPFSSQTSWLHSPVLFGAGSHAYRHFVPPPGTIPFYQLNQTSGAGAASGIQYSTTGNLISTAMLPEGFAGSPCVLEEVRCLGDIAAGGAVAGTEADWQIDFGVETQSGFQFTSNSSAKFTGADPFRSMVKRKGFDNNHGWSTRIQYQLTMNQGTGGTGPTYKSPNGLPFEFSMLVFTDNNPRSPAEVRGPSAY